MKAKGPKPTFLSAKQLKITPQQRYALILTLALLENGEMQHTTETTNTSRPRGDTLGQFNMGVWNDSMQRRGRCNTVSCIGGTAEIVMGGHVCMAPGSPRQPELFDLFYLDTVAWRDGYEMGQVTVKQVAKALRNYLTTGKARWSTVLPRSWQMRK